MSLSKQQMLDALDGLLMECEGLHKQFLANLTPWTPEFTRWDKACQATIEIIFGSFSDALASFKRIYFAPPPNLTFENDLEAGKARLVWFESGLRYAYSSLQGCRYSVARVVPEETRPGPFIFISHGGPTRTHVDAVRDFLSALGLSPIVVADMPNLNLSINEKVRHFIGLAAGAVVLASEEDETLAQESRTRPNVENEIGMLQEAESIGGRIIYLKEPKVQFASNYREKVWIEFNKERVQDAFIDFAKELRAFGFMG